MRTTTPWRPCVGGCRCGWIVISRENSFFWGCDTSVRRPRPSNLHLGFTASTQLTTRMVKCCRAQVSSLGRFRSTRGVISTPSPRADGYVQVMIDGKHHHIHRLIAVAFALPKREDQITVDHIDGDPRNNTLGNLRWASHCEQIKHSYATNAQRKSNAAKISKPVRGRRVGASEWTEYASESAAAEQM